MSHHGIVW